LAQLNQSTISPSYNKSKSSVFYLGLIILEVALLDTKIAIYKDELENEKNLVKINWRKIKLLVE